MAELDIPYWLYIQDDRFQPAVDASRCRYAVPVYRSVRFAQCARRVAEQVKGYGFCRQHAAMLRTRYEAGRRSDEQG